jgi:hypothetical protein
MLTKKLFLIFLLSMSGGSYAGSDWGNSLAILQGCYWQVSAFALLVGHMFYEKGIKGLKIPKFYVKAYITPVGGALVYALRNHLPYQQYYSPWILGLVASLGTGIFAQEIHKTKSRKDKISDGIWCGLEAAAGGFLFTVIMPAVLGQNKKGT